MFNGNSVFVGSFIIERTNSINGSLYQEENWTYTIFGWKECRPKCEKSYSEF